MVDTICCPPSYRTVTNTPTTAKVVQKNWQNWLLCLYLRNELSFSDVSEWKWPVKLSHRRPDLECVSDGISNMLLRKLASLGSLGPRNIPSTPSKDWGISDLSPLLIIPFDTLLLTNSIIWSKRRNHSPVMTVITSRVNLYDMRVLGMGSD
jgi:hypothetical protein